MKIVTAHEMARIEGLAYADGASEATFMEQAGEGIARKVQELILERGLDHPIYLLCGKGNNAGDAYVAGRYLLAGGWQVEAFQVAPLDTCSDLCQKNAARFEGGGGTLHRVVSGDQVVFGEEGIILDGLFGTGFQGETKDLYAQAIERANDSQLAIVAIDIPSGLDGSTGRALGAAIRATDTIFLGLPKTGFFLGDGWSHVGSLHYVDFGLEARYLEQAQEELQLLTHDRLAQFRPCLNRSRHKYQAGFVVGLAGSPGMSGAAVLSGMAALRGGAGIVKILHPAGMEAELANSPWELIQLPFSTRELDWVRTVMVKCSTCFIGPGIAQSPTMRVVVNTVLPELHIPCVIDADAINIMAEERLRPPRQTILTPHSAEMARLLDLGRPPPLSLEYLKQCQEFADNNDVTLALKGGPTVVLHPHQKPSVSSAGNPGMATAGSGDVLTGLISALLSQGLGTFEAASAGVYLHGLAGEAAAGRKTPYCMVASDILEAFPDAFASLWPTEVTRTDRFEWRNISTREEIKV